MTAPTSESGPRPEHVDVLVVGAGLSGIGAACLLRKRCPTKTFAILEARTAIGGTWDLFRYPGVRSDSDMFTLGYSFRPWTGSKAIADGDTIRDYIQATAQHFGVDRAIRYSHRVVSADWNGDTGRWTVTAERGASSRVTLTCSWLSVCSGYYRYDTGHRPAYPGEDRFRGTVVHPQQWPPGLDWSGRRIVVVGSGATAVTLLPSLAAQASHVTMLQRTPSYVLSVAATDPVAAAAQRLLPPRAAYSVVRWKNVLFTTASYQFARRCPDAMKALIRRRVRHALPSEFDVDRHFSPPYKPWDQRLCLAPDGDLFQAVRSGKADIVTDRIATFTENEIELESGRTLPVDIVVSATGLTLLPLGGVSISVDGGPVELPRTVAYKGMMLCGVPNLNLVVGYTNASWTLKADLVSRYVTRLLRHLDAHGFDRATPQPPPDGSGDQPFLDFTSGYVQRGLAQLPTQGRRPPWRLHQNYLRDLVTMRLGPLQDEGMLFSAGPPAPAALAGPAGPRRASGLASSGAHRRPGSTLGE